MNLRPYQAEAVESAFRCWSDGKRAVLFVCPTGGGKSRVFSEIARRFRPKGRTLILADREWLVTQARDNVRNLTPLSAEIEMASARISRAKPPDVVCASIQSMIRRYKAFPRDAFGLIVIDEADLALAPSYRAIEDHFSGARIFGCTATPERGDGLALGQLFDVVCLDVDIRDLIDAGYLCSIRQHAVRVLDLSRVKTGVEDLDEASLERILLEEKHLHEVVAPVMELAGTRPTLVFGVSVAHARALAALFNRYRPGSAGYVHGKMNRKGKRTEVEAFIAGKVQFLCNCVLLTRGVDIPPVACVAMARPTQSRTLYVQMLGRGMRQSPDTGKADLIVLDFGDGADTHSLVSAVDVLGGKQPPEVRERARELLEEAPGGSVTDALDEAARQVAEDPTLRERVIAKARLRVREVEVREATDWDGQPLGKVSDGSLAAVLGVTPSAVRGARERRGIPAFRLNPREVATARAMNWKRQPLGQMSDADLAKKLGILAHHVTAARKRLGVAAYGPNSGRRAAANTAIDWERIPLGKVTDAEAGRIAGCSKANAHDQRVARGIPAFQRIDWDAQPFGKMLDRELAALLGCSLHAVWTQRKKRGIPALPRDQSKVDFDWDEQPLGTVPDSAIAERMGVSPSAVAKARKARGIAARFPRT